MARAALPAELGEWMPLKSRLAQTGILHQRVQDPLPAWVGQSALGSVQALQRTAPARTLSRARPRSAAVSATLGASNARINHFDTSARPPQPLQPRQPSSAWPEPLDGGDHAQLPALQSFSDGSQATVPLGMPQVRALAMEIESLWHCLRLPQRYDDGLPPLLMLLWLTSLRPHTAVSAGTCAASSWSRDCSTVGCCPRA